MAFVFCFQWSAGLGFCLHWFLFPSHSIQLDGWSISGDYLWQTLKSRKGMRSLCRPRSLAGIPSSSDFSLRRFSMIPSTIFPMALMMPINTTAFKALLEILPRPSPALRILVLWISFPTSSVVVNLSLLTSDCIGSVADVVLPVWFDVISIKSANDSLFSKFGWTICPLASCMCTICSLASCMCLRGWLFCLRFFARFQNVSRQGFRWYRWWSQWLLECFLDLSLVLVGYQLVLCFSYSLDSSSGCLLLDEFHDVVEISPYALEVSY